MTNPEKTPIISKKHEVHLNREQTQKRNLLIGLVVTLVLIFGLIGYGLLDQLVLQGLKPVVTVGDTKISVNYFQRIVWLQRYILEQNHKDLASQYDAYRNDQFMAYYLGQQIQQYESQLSPANASQLGQVIMNRMVEDTLISQEAQKRGITASDAEINAYMQEKIFAFYANGTPTPAPSVTPFSTSTLSPLQLTLVPPTATPTALPTEAQTATATATTAPTATAAASEQKATATPDITATPAPTLTPFTQDGYNKLVTKYLAAGASYGITQDDIKNFLRGFILRDKLTAALSVDVKPEEEQVWARHILVADLNTANTVEQRLKAGESFESLAKELSTDTGSKDKGGDLGWFGKGKMVKEFEDVAYSLKIGAISEPVKSQFGYHIIQILGHEVRPVSQTELDSLKADKLSAWLSTQMAAVKVTYADNYLQVIPLDPALKEQDYIFPTPTPGATSN
jgi:peptidyl-prolyl cis-trans isomerase D